MKKKFITGILATLACFACLTGVACKKDGDSGVNLDEVKEYANSTFRVQHTSVREDYTYNNVLNYDGVEYVLTWSVVLPEGVTSGVTVEVKDGKTTINVDENLSADLQYKLVLTITDPADAENTITVEFNRTVQKAPTYVPAHITTHPVVGTAYKFHVYQGATAKDCYLNGNMKNTYFFATTDTMESGLDFYVEAVPEKENTFYLYHNKETAKTYVNVVASGTHINAKYEAAPSSEWVFDAELGTIVTTVSGTKYFLGCDGTYETVEPQLASDATENDYYVGYLTELVDRTTVSNENKIAQTKKEIALPAVHVGAGSITLPAIGVTFPESTVTWTVDGTGATIADGKLTVATAPAATTSYTLTATIACGDKTDTKAVTVKYIPNETKAILDAASALENNADFANEVTLTGIVSGFMKNGNFNETYGNISVYLMVEYDGTAETVEGKYKTIGCFHLGTEGTVDVAGVTIGDTLTVKGVFTNFNGSIQLDQDCKITEVVNDGDKTDVPGYVPNPTLSTTEPYKLYINAKGSDSEFENYYITGEVTSGKFLTTTTVAANGKDVYAEKVNDSYKFYIVNADESRSYINARLNGTSKVVEFTSTTESVFDYDQTTKAWYTKIGDVEYYIGSYDEYTTISLAEKYRITTETSGVSQYPATLTLSSEFAPDDTATDAEKVAATVTEIPSLGTVYVGNTTVENLPTAGVAYDDVAINWAVVGDGATYADGTLTFNPTVTGTITVTATVSKGEESDSSKTFTIKLVKNDPADIVDAAYELDNKVSFSNEVTLTGVIKTVDYGYSSTNNNITVTITVNGADEAKPIKCYKLVDGTATAISKLAVGDTISVKGILKRFNSDYEFDSGCTLESYTPAPATSKTIVEALAMGASLADYASTAPVRVTGTIINVENATDGIMTIADAEGNCIYVYKTDYSALTGKTLAFGNTVTLEGVVNKHKGNVQLKNTTATAIETPTTIDDIYKVYAVGNFLTVKTNITKNDTDTLTVGSTEFTDVTVVWTSNNACAVIDPANTVTYTLPAETTTVTLTATVKISETIKKDYTFEVEVAAAYNPNATSGEISFAANSLGTTTISSWYKDSQYEIVGTDPIPSIYLTPAKNDASTEVAYNKSGYIRLYQAPADGKNGGSLTITCEAGYKITAIEVTTAQNPIVSCSVTGATKPDTIDSNTFTLTVTEYTTAGVTITNTALTSSNRIDITNLVIHWEKLPE